MRKHGRLFSSRGEFLHEVAAEPMSPIAALTPIAEAVIELLTQARPERIRQCADEDCVLWFIDRSRNGRRRWCSMATCGNRNKVAAHYRRGADG